MCCSRLNRTVGVLVGTCLCLGSFLTFSEPPSPAQAVLSLEAALGKHRVQTRKGTRAQEVRNVPAVDTSLPASPPLSTADRTLVRWCLARYGLWSVSAEQEQAERSAEQAARRFFDAMPRAEIARRLVPIRKALYRGTRAYTSVAFVLAYYGSDFERNAQRVVEAIALGPEPPAKLKAAGFKEQGEDPSGAEEVADAVETLYRRHHSAAMLRAYLRAPVDGHLGEDWGATIGSLFLAYPAEVLRAASDPDDMKRLAECVYDGADDSSKVGRILRRLEHSRDPHTARLARRFHRVYASKQSRG
jgi:hypothetical protein